MSYPSHAIRFMRMLAVVSIIGTSAALARPRRFTTVADGLCSPRHITIYNERIYVAESGSGPIPVPEDPAASDVCIFSETFNAFICWGDEDGQVSSFALDGRGDPLIPLANLWTSRTIDGQGSDHATGPAAVSFDSNGNMYTTLGLGPIDGNALLDIDPRLVFGSVLRSTMPSSSEVVSTPWVAEFANNYDGTDVNSNPYDLLFNGEFAYVVDAGANAMFTYQNIDDNGLNDPVSVMVFPRFTDIPAASDFVVCQDVTPPMGPPFCGQRQGNNGEYVYDADSVPTAVVMNPNEPGRLYIAFLGGAIWNAPVADVKAVMLVDGIPQADTMETVVGGFWAIFDITFDDNDKMYILEANPGGLVPFRSRVTIFDLKTQEQQVLDTQAMGIVDPASIAIYDGMLYLTNNTYSEGADDCNGQVVAGSLGGRPGHERTMAPRNMPGMMSGNMPGMMRGKMPGMMRGTMRGMRNRGMMRAMRNRGMMREMRNRGMMRATRNRGMMQRMNASMMTGRMSGNMSMMNRRHRD